jgi:hypothetical protein
MTSAMDQALEHLGEDHKRARDFAGSIAERGYPHSGAIEEYGAVVLEGVVPETWRIGRWLIVVRPEHVAIHRLGATAL